MTGQPSIQNLINVHFSVDENDATQIPPAMLYTVFSSQVLAMVVRHGPTDYVMQIPYFPPYTFVFKSVRYDLGQGGAWLPRLMLVTMSIWLVMPPMSFLLQVVLG